MFETAFRVESGEVNTKKMTLLAPFLALAPESDIDENNILEIIAQAGLTKAEVEGVERVFRAGESLAQPKFDIVREKISTAVTVLRAISD